MGRTVEHALWENNQKKKEQRRPPQVIIAEALRLPLDLSKQYASLETLTGGQAQKVILDGGVSPSDDLINFALKKEGLPEVKH